MGYTRHARFEVSVGAGGIYDTNRMTVLLVDYLSPAFLGPCISRGKRAAFARTIRMLPARLDQNMLPNVSVLDAWCADRGGQLSCYKSKRTVSIDAAPSRALYVIAGLSGLDNAASSLAVAEDPILQHLNRQSFGAGVRAEDAY